MLNLAFAGDDTINLNTNVGTDMATNVGIQITTNVAVRMLQLYDYECRSLMITNVAVI